MGSNRLDVFAGGNLPPADVSNPLPFIGRLVHKTWNGTAWLPSVDGYEDLGGNILFPPAVASWGPNRLDIFGASLATDVWGNDINGPLNHKAWNGSNWLPSVDGFDNLGGQCTAPAVASWGSDRLDIFVVGANNSLYHKAWNGTTWLPSVDGYENLGGQWATAPTVASWAPGRLDIFIVDSIPLDAPTQPYGNLYHKAWDGTQNKWLPSQTGYDNLGGQVTWPWVQTFPRQ